MRLIGALAFVLLMNVTPARAAVPPLGTAEGELLCAGWTNVLASGAVLTTGADTAAAIKAYGIFLGRLSVIAPNAQYRLQDFLTAFQKMSVADQDQLAENCLAKLREVDLNSF